jgi:type II secretory pathway pseudopilin PulG
MVISYRTTRQRAGLIVELLVAIAILSSVALPIAYSIGSERRFARSMYQRAVAMELVDGEMEALAAGEWRHFKSGAHNYIIKSSALTNLPPGAFVLTVRPERIRLEWRPAQKQHGGPVFREVAIK